MRQVNLAGIDLNLVPALEALLRLRNVTRAADEVGISQPAMSRALARLRALHGDPLLVRTRVGYALTPQAEALQPQLLAAVISLREVFQSRSFDPATEQRTLRLAASDVQTVMLLPSIMARLAVEAPAVELRVETYRPDLFDRIENGSTDLAFALASTPLPPGIFSETFGEDRLALVMRRAHPAAARTWSVADYGEVGHVVIALLGDGRSDMDALLAAAGVSRQIVLVTPHFMAALAVVAATDLVTTISAALAGRFASTFDLILHEPPLADTRLVMTLVCSHVRAADPLLVWMKTLVRKVAVEATLAAAAAK